MENKQTASTQENETRPLAIRQALIGLEFGLTDESILRYFNFFTKNVPTAGASFLHVAPNFDRFSFINMEELADMRVDFLQEKGELEMQEKIKKYFSNKENMEVDFDLKEGNPLGELLDAAEEMTADLIVIGQKKGSQHHGILAKKFARKAKGNALVIPEKSKPEIKSILVPVDFSENSGRALQAAMALKLQLDEPAKLTVLNVATMPDGSSYRISRSPSQLQKIAEGNLKEALENFLEKYIPAEKDEIESVIQFKDMPQTAEYIYSYAKESDTDFIVMGAKGHSRVHLLLMGSITEKLLNLNEDFPTLIVK